MTSSASSNTTTTTSTKMHHRTSTAMMETVLDVFWNSSSSSSSSNNNNERSQETILKAILAGSGILALSLWNFARRRHSRRILADKIEPIPQHGGDLVAEVLVKHKVQHLFTLIGGHISPVLVASKQRGIRVIDVRHEVNAVFAADAVTRLSNGVGVAIVTAGPGLTNVVTAIQNCFMAQSPLVLLGGATLGLLKHKGSLQDMDQQQIFQGCVKWQTSITRTRDIIPKLEEAFFRAMHGVPGPVFVELPLDVLYPEERIRNDALAKLEGKDGIVASLTRFYLKWYFRRLYGTGVHEEAPSIPWKPEPQIASERAIDRAVRMIVQAQKPVLVVGSQAVMNRKDLLGDTYLYTLDTVVQSLRSLEIPAFLAGGARGCLGIGDDAKLHIRHKRSAALKQADLVVLLGVPCDFRLNYGLSLKSHTTKVIAVNIDKKELYLNQRPHLAVHAEVPDFIVRVAQQLASQGNRKAWEEWRAQLQYECEKRDEEIQVQSQFKLPAVVVAPDETDDNNNNNNNKTVEVCNPISVCLALDESLRTPSVLVCDGGDFIATAAQTIQPRNPQCWLDPGPFGTLGVGAGFALGAKLVRPYSDVWLLWGDGSAAYSIMEYDTFVRHGINVIGVIGNDACWRQIHRDQVLSFDDDVGCNLAFSDYHEVAKALGGQGYVVSNEDEMKPTIEKAYVDVKSKPVLINVLIGKTSFRDGSVSV